MNLSPHGIALLHGEEGCKLSAYRDGAGVWTIGRGCTEGVHGGMVITQANADKMFLAMVAPRIAQLNALLGNTPTTQNEFDALFSLLYNEGQGAVAHSTVLRLHRAGDHAGAAKAFGLFDKITIHGKLVHSDGLANRRAAESALYLK